MLPWISRVMTKVSGAMWASMRSPSLRLTSSISAALMDSGAFSSGTSIRVSLA